MDVIWLAPAASIALIAIAIPILIHLLTRQRARVVPFPTLRFLHATRLSALRRRAIEDWWLLLVRVAILTAAAGALAAPVFVSVARQAAWKMRVVSAFIVAPSADVDGAAQSALISTERANRFASEVFAPSSRVADGLRDATSWLAQQPPASREVVIVGDLREGAMAKADLVLVPEHAAIRFLPLPAMDRRRDAEVRFQQMDTVWRATVSLLEDRTRATYVKESTKGLAPIVVRAAPPDQAFASVALDAVLARGINLPADPRRVVIVFDGGDTSDLQADGNLVILRAQQRANGIDAVRTLERLVHEALTQDRRALEPSPIPASTLAAWSRPPQGDLPMQPSDEGDRRWLWGAAVVLMLVEHWLGRRRAGEGRTAAPPEEQRVA